MPKIPESPAQPAQGAQSLPTHTSPAEHAAPLAHLGWWAALVLLAVGLAGAGIAALRPLLLSALTGAAHGEPRQTVYTPLSDLPAYHLIRAAELTSTLRLAPQLPQDVVTATTRLVGAVSLMPLRAGQPITTGQLLAISDSRLISNTVVVAVEGGARLAFGGQLRPGAIVACWSGAQQIVDRALVLDARRVEAAMSSAAPLRYVVILAIPRDRRDEIALANKADSLSFSLEP